MAQVCDLLMKIIIVFLKLLCTTQAFARPSRQQRQREQQHGAVQWQQQQRQHPRSCFVRLCVGKVVNTRFKEKGIYELHLNKYQYLLVPTFEIFAWKGDGHCMDEHKQKKVADISTYRVT